MLTTSHLFWSAQIRPSATRLWLLGAVAPDLPAIGQAAVLRARGYRPGEVVTRIYHHSPWREVQLSAHSVYGPLALTALTGRAGREFAGGWLGHLLVDAVSHHDDAWPLLWPLSSRRWTSPLSYWQREHHARWFLGAELFAVITARRRTHHPALTLLTAAVTAFALRQAFSTTSGGCDLVP